MEYILSFLWVFIEVAYFIAFNAAFMPKQRRDRKFRLIYFVSSCIIALSANLLDNPIARLLVSYSCYVTLSFMLFRGNIVRRLLIAIVSFVFSGIIDTAILYGACALLNISLNEFAWKKFAYSAVVTLGKFLALLLAWIIYKVRINHTKHTVKVHWLLLTITFPCASLLMLTVIYPSYQGSDDLSAGAFIFSIGLAVANIAILYLIHRMEKQTQKEHEMILLNQQMQIQTDSILALEKSYQTQRKATHEFRHHLQTMGDLLENNDVQDAIEYIQIVLNSQTERLLCVNSHHPVIDAVINQKYQAARDRNTDMIIQVNDLSCIKLKADAIVVLLSNLLDNAIEACDRLETERIIQCRILAGDTLFISIRNTSAPVHIVGDIIPTTKYPQHEHGFGLLNIKHILASLNAEYTYQYSEGWFEFVIEIPLVEDLVSV